MGLSNDEDEFRPEIKVRPKVLESSKQKPPPPPAAKTTRILKVGNISPSATKDELHELFSYLGRIDECKLYPSSGALNQVKIGYIKFDKEKAVLVAQHLTNTVFIDRALVCVLCSRVIIQKLFSQLHSVPFYSGMIPDEEMAMQVDASISGQRQLPPNVVSQEQDAGDGQKVIVTIDPNLVALGLPPYPPLPAIMEPSKIEEIRRTVYVGNLEKSCDGDELMNFFNTNIGEVMYLRMTTGSDSLPCAYAYVEFSNQTSVSLALQNNGIEYQGRTLRIQHSRVAIIKPQQKTADQALAEVEEAIKCSVGKEKENSALLFQMNRKAILSWSTRNCNSFSNLARAYLSTKQLIYKERGDPSKILQLQLDDLDLNSLGQNEVVVRWLASPVNPADINQLQGVYPVKPELPAVAGNEGLGVCMGSFIHLVIAGFLLMSNNLRKYEQDRLYRIDKTLPMIDAATLQVNPPTAYRMLRDFISLVSGDVVVQNGGNSSVGRYVIQICRNMGLKSVSVVRDRPTVTELKTELKDLGADDVFTEEEFAKESRNMKGVKLGLNCVGGRSSLLLARILSPGGCMVSYGGMSKQPVQVPTGSLIFSDISLRGFWMSRWYDKKENQQERDHMYKVLGGWIKDGKLVSPKVKENKIEEYTKAISSAMSSDEMKQIFVF
uniref:Enoyl-[acyl-carrier-protein] reductase, mitochondrial n=1 Tax=Ditylenchus dipsaci TaxID=166011 RepID=A0A915ECC7_9BILA